MITTDDEYADVYQVLYFGLECFKIKNKLILKINSKYRQSMWISMLIKAKYFKKLWGGAGQWNILQENKTM